MGNFLKKSRALLTEHFQILFLQRRLVFFPALQQGFGPVQAQQNYWKNRFFAGFYFTDWIKYNEKTFCRLLGSKLGYPICCFFFMLFFFIISIDIHRSWVPWSAASPQDWVPSCDHSNIFSTNILFPKIKKIDGYKNANTGAILTPGPILIGSTFASYHLPGFHVCSERVLWLGPRCVDFHRVAQEMQTVPYKPGNQPIGCTHGDNKKKAKQFSDISSCFP